MTFKPIGTFGSSDPAHGDYRIYRGDNAEVLEALRQEFEGKIRFVYIDPPYNTGRLQYRSFRDRFWDHYSRDRHGNWLAFMRTRLERMMPLLAPDARVFVSIDDAEMPHLTLLLRELFGKDAVETMIWDKIPGGGSAGQGKMKRVKRFRIEHEYILAAYKNRDAVRFRKVKRLMPVQKHYGNPDNDPRGPWVSAELCKSEAKSLPGRKNYYTVVTPGGRRITRQWHVSREEFERLDREGRIWWGNGRIIPRLKKFIREPYPATPGSIIRNISQTEGKHDLEKYVADAGFYNPKPVRLIRYLLETAASPGDIVLDFFAGTGSTGHAVMEWNRESGEKLSCILVSNNENDSLDRLLIPRLKGVSAETGGKWRIFEGNDASLS
ncbi:MAG: site-specific DNA-methyltransferase [Chlorobi bacterium]|nr:site-specific DNA-methyltransferase [Chlorobiota bacterium]